MEVVLSLMENVLRPVSESFLSHFPHLSIKRNGVHSVFPP